MDAHRIKIYVSQTPPNSSIAKLVEAIVGIDLLQGSRFANCSKYCAGILSFISINQPNADSRDDKIRHFINIVIFSPYNDNYFSYTFSSLHAEITLNGD